MHDKILDGLKGQNEQAKAHGVSGFWVQGDCVFMQASTPHTAIEHYRERIAEARIAINHNHACGSIIARKAIRSGLPTASPSKA